MSAIVTDLEQAVYDRQRMVTAVRSSRRTEPAMRRALKAAGLPVTPPKASDASDALMPRLTCSACLVRKPYDAFGPVRLVPALRRLPYQRCDACREIQP